jgi:hypothetical protein
MSFSGNRLSVRDIASVIEFSVVRGAIERVVSEPAWYPRHGQVFPAHTPYSSRGGVAIPCNRAAITRHRALPRNEYDTHYSCENLSATGITKMQVTSGFDSANSLSCRDDRLSHYRGPDRIALPDHCG